MQALVVTWFVFVVASNVCFLITAILVINNLRDIHTDQKAGKNTLAVILGERLSKIEYALLFALSYSVLPIIWMIGWASPWIFLPLLSLPWAVSLVRTVWKSDIDPRLNIMLAKTATLSLVSSILLSIGFLLT